MSRPGPGRWWVAGRPSTEGTLGTVTLLGPAVSGDRRRSSSLRDRSRHHATRIRRCPYPRNQPVVILFPARSPSTAASTVAPSHGNHAAVLRRLSELAAGGGPTAPGAEPDRPTR